MSLNEKRQLSQNLSDSEDDTDFPHKRKKKHQNHQRGDFKSEILNASDSLLNTFNDQQEPTYPKSEYVPNSKTNFATKLMVT